MSSIDIHSEQFEELLAEALRGGPGTPAWRQAVDALQAAGNEGEEMAMLCRAREDLAAGREYRRIHAGPGFTQKLMARLDRESTKQWQLPTANVVTMLAIGMLVLVVAAGAWMLFKPAKPGSTIVDLQETFFVNALANESFAAPEPKGFVRVGLLPLVSDNGLKVEVRSREGEQHIGGGVYFARGLDPAGAYAAEGVIAVENPQTRLATELFVTDSPEFAAGTGLSQHELACHIEGGRFRIVLPDGKTAADAAFPDGDATIKIRFDRESAVVELNSKVVWSGQHQLAGDAERYVGVRHLTKGGDKSSGVTVKALRILMP